MKFLAKVKCSKCGNTEFKITKKLEGETKEDVIQDEVLCHEGFGWDISSFDLECTECKSIEDNEINTECYDIG